MHLTLFTDYALRSLMYLTWHQGRLSTSEEIARFFEISQDHVVKVIQQLARKGYVRSRRGRHGGVRLAKSPETIRLGDIIRDLEQISLLECLNSRGVCVIEGNCKLQGILREGQRRMMNYLDEFTLADFAGSQPEAADLVPIGLERLPV
ncbi:MAG: RrF2 family transcriptional regulator [Gemmataceae bacterium]